MTFTVSINPGDNFKICSSVHRNALGKVTQAKVNSGNLPLGVTIGEMLTAWRKLHVEVDSMAAVPTEGDEKNFVAGNITGVAGAGPWTATTDQTLDDADMYEKGTLVKGGTNYTVKTGAGANTSGANSQAVLTNANPGNGAFTSLTDDDTKVMPDLPDTSKMNDIFDDCYIVCVNDAIGGGEDVTFTLNWVPGKPVDRDSVLTEAADWWVVYVLGGYQGALNYDCDPDSEGALGGITETPARQVSVVFLETITDTSAIHGYSATTIERQLVVHEISHQVLESGTHTNNTIMQLVLPVASQYEKFSDADINTIRGKPSSPGE